MDQPFQFNANQYEPATAPAAMPKGQYPAVITASEKKENSKQTGSYIQIDFKFIVAPFDGRTIKSFLNVSNPNQQTMDIAFSELSAICHSIGVLAPMVQANGAIPELYNKPLLLSIKVDKDDYNQITGYAACDPALLAGIPGFGVASPAPIAPVVPVAQTATAAAPKFDPNTGQPIAQQAAPVQQAAVQYDPNTGQPIVTNAIPEIKNPNPIGQPALPTDTVKGPWD